MLPRLLPAAAVLAALALAPASAGAATFKVVKATHSSTSAKTEGTYSGRSTTTWNLAKPGRIAINRAGTALTGLAYLKVRGEYGIDAATDWGHCAWTAATGDETYTAVAPEDLSLTVGPDPRTGRGTIVSFGAARASLSNPYIGSECSTSITGEPDPETTSARRVKPSLFKNKTVTLRYKGSSTDEGIAYTWSTVIVLRRR